MRGGSGPASNDASARRFGSSPSGRLWPVKAANAMPWMGIALSGDPLTEKVPLANSRSSSDTSSWWAAMVRALSITLSVAMATAVPPTASDRDP